MRVCIVGGTGNISTSIVRLLLEEGHDVTCFNRGESGTSPDGARHIQGNRDDTEAYEATMQAEAFDAAIDMICFKKEQAESSLRAFRGVQHFVHCSTVCTYGVEYDYMPVDEVHPLRPTTGYGRNKVLADDVFLAAHRDDGFPVTIIKPSSTYGPKMGALRQVAFEFSWVDRIRKSKPILVCGDGSVIHQFMHVDEAAPAFVHCLGKPQCVGNVYNMVKRGFTSWINHHRTAMKVLGREVELVGVPLADLVALEVPNVGICVDIFAFNLYYSAERLFADVPEFRPRISLEEGLASVIEALDSEGRIPDSDEIEWEDRIIAAQRAVRNAK